MMRLQEAPLGDPHQNGDGGGVVPLQAGRSSHQGAARNYACPGVGEQHPAIAAHATSRRRSHGAPARVASCPPRRLKLNAFVSSGLIRLPPRTYMFIGAIEFERLDLSKARERRSELVLSRRRGAMAPAARARA